MKALLLLLPLPLAALSAPPDMAATKAALRSAARSADRGFSRAAGAQQLKSDVQRWTRLLEDSDAGDSRPTASPSLLGRWTLEFTDASDVLSLAVLPPGIFCEIGEIVQEIAPGDSDGSFEASNIVVLSPRGAEFLASLPLRPGGTLGPRLTGLFAVDAACTVLDDRRLQLVFVGGRAQPLVAPVELPALSGRAPDPIVSGLQQLVGERIYLETTYLDDDLRVARGPGQELYILSKTYK